MKFSTTFTVCIFKSNYLQIITTISKAKHNFFHCRIILLLIISKTTIIFFWFRYRELILEQFFLREEGMPLDWCGFVIVSASPSPISIAKHLLMPLQNNLVFRHYYRQCRLSSFNSLFGCTACILEIQYCDSWHKWAKLNIKLNVHSCSLLTRQHLHAKQLIIMYHHQSTQLRAQKGILNHHRTTII